MTRALVREPAGHAGPETAEAARDQVAAIAAEGELAGRWRRRDVRRATNRPERRQAT